MKKRGTKVLLLFFALLGIIASTACFTGLGDENAPTVNTLPTEYNDKKMAAAVSSYSLSYDIPPQWVVGVVWQESYQKAYGLNADEYNRVRIRVYTPNALETIIPCNPLQEMHFVRDYDPGDIIAYSLPAARERLSTTQDKLYLCLQDVIMIKKGGIWEK